jgi:hypothetical protein
LRIFAFIFTCLHKQNVSVLLVFISSSSSSFCSSPSFLRVVDTFLVVLGGGAKNKDEVVSAGGGKEEEEEEEENPSRDAVFEKSAKAPDARRIGSVSIISSSRVLLCVYLVFFLAQRRVLLPHTQHKKKTQVSERERKQYYIHAQRCLDCSRRRSTKQRSRRNHAALSSSRHQDVVVVRFNRLSFLFIHHHERRRRRRRQQNWILHREKAESVNGHAFTPVRSKTTAERSVREVLETILLVRRER